MIRWNARAVMASCLCVGVLAANSAFAADLNERGIQAIEDIEVSAGEARQELFGVRLAGVTSFGAETWMECVEPDGDTLYTFAGSEQRGRLKITDDALACFSYDTDNHETDHCFVITRRDGGYAFWGGYGSVFYTTSVERGVAACPSEGVPIG